MSPGEVQRWSLMTQAPAYDGWLPITRRTYRMPDGSLSEWDIHTPGFTTVAVLALTGDGQVVATRQYRPGPDAILFEPPGGVVDPGEEILTAARRELREETGYSCESVELVGTSWAFGASTWLRHAAVARGCRLAGEVTSWGGDEYCEPVLLSVDELRETLRAGRTTDTDLLYLALDHAGLL